MKGNRVVALAVVLCLGAFLQAQSMPGLIPEEVLRLHNLERAWFTQTRVSPAHGWLTSIKVHISSKIAMTVYEVHYPGGVAVVTERDPDPLGRPLGKEGAAKAANELKDRLVAQGKEATVVEVPQVPDISLYVAASTGVVQAVDGETGRTRWVTKVGNRYKPTLDPFATDDFVAVVNGSELYLLNSADGRLIWQRKLEGIPGAGPVIAGNQIYVPRIDGRVEAYVIDQPKRWPTYYQSFGSIYVQPAVGSMSVIWPSSRGYVNFARIDAEGIRYRVQSDWTFNLPIVTVPPDRVLVATAEGYLYCLQEQFGDVVWRYSTGERTHVGPVSIGDRVYVITEDGGMHCLALDDGSLLWRAPRARGFVAASESRVYVRDQIGNLLVLDASTGGELGEIAAQLYDLHYVNTSTDRIYLATRHGLLQCLREVGRRWPMIHVGGAEAAAKQGGPEGPAEAAAEPAGPTEPAGAPPAGANPFGQPPPAGGNPFGQPPAGANPFGQPPASGNPFGQPPASGNPFGGSGQNPPASNPFDPSR